MGRPAISSQPVGKPGTACRASMATSVDRRFFAHLLKCPFHLGAEQMQAPTPLLGRDDGVIVAGQGEQVEQVEGFLHGPQLVARRLLAGGRRRREGRQEVEVAAAGSLGRGDCRFHASHDWYLRYWLWLAGRLSASSGGPRLGCCRYCVLRLRGCGVLGLVGNYLKAQDFGGGKV